MLEVIFSYEGINTIFLLNIYDKMKNLINKYLIKIDKKEINLYYLYKI